MDRAIRVIDPAWIPLSDGTRLCARIWLPEDADRNPVPAILEAQPYRKDDVYANEDALLHPFFAAQGYANVRLDLRGAGDSEGVLLDEYHPRETDDLVEVIAWLAQQPWCDGNVGMMGISWSGFNSLQVAARRPPALKAIITVCSTDDRFDNDVHYYGGLPLGYYLMPWSSVMYAFNARPPDPAIVGDRWREMWLERLQADTPLIETWLEHGRRDAYWATGSVCEDYGAIDCAVLAIGGWADAYTDAIPRLLEHLDCPRQGLIGPWGHLWPNFGLPGPAIGFLEHATRWWDHWLKGADNGIMASEPLLRAWMQDASPPGDVPERPGRWVAEPAWPPADAAQRAHTLHLTAAGTLDAQADGPVELQHRSDLTLGLDAGAWCAYGNAGDLPVDQRREDAGSLTFDSAPLTETIELLGLPRVRLTVAADKPRAFVMARLNDLAPDGTSTVITRGAINLCHSEGRDRPQALTPGEPVELDLTLKVVGYAVPAGHRLRLALSTSYWPWLWPSPELATITVQAGSVVLPTRTAQPQDDQLEPFAPPSTATPLATEQLRPRRPRLEVERDVLTGRTTLRMARDFTGAKRFPSGVEYWDADPVTFTIVDDDPLSTRVDCHRRIEIRRPELDWSTRIEVHAVMTADAERYLVSSTLDAYEGETRIHTASHTKAIPRDHA